MVFILSSPTRPQLDCPAESLTRTSWGYGLDIFPFSFLTEYSGRKKVSSLISCQEILRYLGLDTLKRAWIPGTAEANVRVGVRREVVQIRCEES